MAEAYYRDASDNFVKLTASMVGAAASSHTHTNLVSRGNVTAETGTTDIATSGLSMSQAYNNGYPITYGNVLNMRGSGMSQLLCGWSGSSGAYAALYYRNQRDTSDANWSSWARIYTTLDKPTCADIGAATSSHTHSNYLTTSGTAAAATKLATARTINGTSFNGTANITTANWGTARSITIGNTSKSVNGSANVSWSLSEIGAAATNHNHGLLHSTFGVQLANTTTDSGWSMINSSYSGYLLKSLRTQQNAPNWIENNYAAGICFGGADTKGVISAGYSNSRVTFAGGNGTKPVWYWKLTGANGASYDLSSFVSTSNPEIVVSSSQPFNSNAKLWVKI